MKARPERIVKAGDVVTWASCCVAEKVLRVTPDGVIVWYAGGGREHFVAWDGWSQEPMLRDQSDERKADCRLRFDSISGDFVDPKSYEASVS